MGHKYPARLHAERVAVALQAEKGLIYIPGSASRDYQDSDMPREFRQARYFYYMSGVNEPDCHLTYNIATGALVLWIPQQRSTREILYMGPVLSKEDALTRYEIDDALPAHDLKDFLQTYLETGDHILYLLRPSDATGIWSNGGINSYSLMPALNSCRVIKDEYEINCIRKANQITREAHIQALRYCTKVSNESAIHGIYLGTCITLGAKVQAYEPIVGAGEHAATLHYVRNNGSLAGKQLVLMDAGCEWKDYACDVTRTFPLAGDWPTEESRAIYELVELMQKHCIAAVKPGVLFRSLQVLAHQIMVGGLLSLGILQGGSRDEIIRAGTSAAFLPHGLGHHLGLEVHDVEDETRPMLELGDFDLPYVDHACSILDFASQYKQLFDDSMCHAPALVTSGGLRPGMVVTIEPGIYFNEFGLQNVYLPDPVHIKYINVDVLKRYMPVGGVRIEDDILVTEDGWENLTTTPKGEEALKYIRGEL